MSAVHDLAALDQALGRAAGALREAEAACRILGRQGHGAALRTAAFWYGALLTIQETVADLQESVSVERGEASGPLAAIEARDVSQAHSS